jgi:hypothetical protein
MAREREWIIPSWELSRQNLQGVALPLCDSSFHTWSVAPGGPIRRNWRRQRSAPPRPLRCAYYRDFRSLVAANRSAAG